MIYKRQTTPTNGIFQSEDDTEKYDLQIDFIGDLKHA